MDTRRRFDEHVLPHLDAAYNLARWLARNRADAEDVVQEACVRALRYAGSLRAGDGRAWFLTIVRNAFYDWVRRNRPLELVHDAAVDGVADAAAADPQQAALRQSEARVLAEALEVLPLQFREVVVLRELEDLSYREIATVLAIPVGTVMSRLSRGRELLRQVPALRDEAQRLAERHQS